jgi:hypothetical protein
VRVVSEASADCPVARLALRLAPTARHDGPSLSCSRG